LSRLVWVRGKVSLRSALVAIETLARVRGIAVVFGDLEAPARASALVWVGVCRASLGDEDTAREDFTRALLLDANVSYPAQAPPKIEALFREVRSAMPAALPESPAREPPATVAPPAASPLPAVATVALGVTAATALAGGALLALAGLATAERSQQAELFVDEVKAAVDEANLELGGAAALGAAGAALAVGAGVATWWWFAPADAAPAATKAPE